MATRDTYTKQEWENMPSEETPINAERLGHIEQGIKYATDKRALRDIYGDSGTNTGLSNTVDSVNCYIMNGNGSTIQGGSDIFINGDGNIEKNGSANSINGMGNNVTNGIGNTVNGMGNNVTNGQCLTVEGNKNKIYSSSFSHVGGSDNKKNETGSMHDVFMYGTLNECRESSSGAVFGAGNILKGNSQFVAGKYNKEDEYKSLIFGGGKSETDRKNIFSLDWYGNAEFSGDVSGNGISLSGLKAEIEELRELISSTTKTGE